jgi:hypothetical protein
MINVTYTLSASSYLVSLVLGKEFEILIVNVIVSENMNEKMNEYKKVTLTLTEISTRIE